MTSAQEPGIAAAAFENLGTLHQLTLEAGLSATRQQLIFRILNRTMLLCPYERAVLWAHPDSRPRLLGVSGEAEVRPDAALPVLWRDVIASLVAPETAQVLDATSVGQNAGAWEGLKAKVPGLSVLWIPINVQGRLVAGLWLERWQNAAWTPAQQKQLASLALGYGVAWSRFHGEGLLQRLAGGRAWQMAGLVLLAVVLLLGLVPVPLRVVAPCEVVPRDPVVVTAPLDGVIQEVHVESGRAVEAGALLALYDDRVAREEERVASQQVEIIQSRLQRTRVLALDSAAARADLPMLEERLKQEKIRLHLAAFRVQRSRVVAPVAGSVAAVDRHEWRGRPVKTGERILMLVQPGHTRVRLWIPETDNITLAPGRGFEVVLFADPRQRRQARITYIAQQAEMSPRGFYGFRAEAVWETPSQGLHLGLSGTAILHGESVSLAYWLLRKPWAWLRVHLGF